MRRARAIEEGRRSAPGREADTTASRPTPLTLVAGAVAGDDLQSVAAVVAQALSCPVAIAIPALGDPVVSPAGSVDAEVAATIVAHAGVVIEADGEPRRSVPEAIAEAVSVRIADRVVGIVAAVARPGPPSGDDASALERRAWLEAAGAAASVTALIRDAHGTGPAVSGADLVAELGAGTPADLHAFLSRARRLGIELGGGAVAICGVGDGTGGADPSISGRSLIGEPPSRSGALIAPRGSDRLLVVVPLAADGSDAPARALAERLRGGGWSSWMSAPRRDPALLHQAVLEAELLAQLRAEPHDPGSGAGSAPAGQDETYRLLIGVLLRDRTELEQLRGSTVSPLADYDARHDTELLATLRAFLTHDGSTTETAEAMSLHRHTVGYRLSRVHEVSGLSPYASDGRERLSLGIKAQQILEAERDRLQP